MSESGPWSHGVSPEALDNVAFIDNAMLQYGPLPDTANNIPQDDAEEITDALRVQDIPESSSFIQQTCRWPRLNIMDKGCRPRYAQDQIAALLRDLGLNGIRTPSVNHRGPAWGLVIQHPSGWKIVYSGDTKPCQKIVDAGKGATLLIHEATLEDDKADLAIEKGHSTFSQAIDVGVRMNAKRILLNHFSQRYPKLPKTRATEDNDRDVSISYDMMTIKVGDMWKMKYYMDAAEMLFAEEDDADVEKAVETDVNATPVAEPKSERAKNRQQHKENRMRQREEMANRKAASSAQAKRPASPGTAGGERSGENGVKRTRSDQGDAPVASV